MSTTEQPKSERRICATCAHFKDYDHAPNAGYGDCMRKVQTKQDRVSGEVFSTDKLDARNERYVGECGEAGKFWTPKPEPMPSPKTQEALDEFAKSAGIGMFVCWACFVIFALCVVFL